MNSHYSSNTYTFLSYLNYQKRKYAYSSNIVLVQNQIYPKNLVKSFLTNKIFEDDDDVDYEYDSTNDEPDDNLLFYGDNDDYKYSNEFCAYPKQFLSEEHASCNLFTGIWT